MSAFFNNGVKVLKDNATNIMGVVKQEVLSNVSPCRTHRQELKDLVNFIIENSVVGDESEEGNTYNIMINNLKKVTTMCANDINDIIIEYKETPRYDEFVLNGKGKYVKKLLSQQDTNLTFRMLFKNNHLLNANFNDVYLDLQRNYQEICTLRINIVVKSNGSNDYAIYYNGADIIDVTTLEYPLTANHNDEVKKTPIYAYEFTKIILNEMPEGINYNEAVAKAKAAAGLGGGKRKSKGNSKKVAKKPVVSQKKQSIYKEIFGKKMKIYKMPDSRKEYVKYKGDLHLITDYKDLMKQKANAKPKAKPKK
jgi:hypothetical protein